MGENGVFRRADCAGNDAQSERLPAPPNGVRRQLMFNSKTLGDARVGEAGLVQAARLRSNRPPRSQTPGRGTEGRGRKEEPCF